MTKVIVESLCTFVSSHRSVGKNVFLRFMQPNTQRCKTGKSKNSGNFFLHIVSGFIFFLNCLIFDVFKNPVVFCTVNINTKKLYVLPT